MQSWREGQAHQHGGRVPGRQFVRIVHPHQADVHRWIAAHAQCAHAPVVDDAVGSAFDRDFAGSHHGLGWERRVCAAINAPA